MNKLASLLVLLCISIGISAQDMDSYFDDGGITNSPNRVKTEPLLLLKGYVPLSYQHIFFDRLILEAGGGLILPGRIFDIEQYMADNYPLNDEELSYYWKAEAGVFVYKKAQSGVYLSLGYSQRFHNNYTLTDYYPSVVYQLNTSGRLIFEYQIGLKIITQKEAGYMNYDEIYPFYKLGINIAYIL